ncbi:hypothetical protein [Bacillus phage Hakuna]|uniref:Uncharacterized protein n=3 Tax=Wphvirus TaxID=1922327 RepID=A0A222Z3N7_9CAUD|nr:hypothetical protein FP72_gp240 [Bacillus phage Hakuna]YP_009279415.1 hypothetical protein BIZ89_gp248 [Bacillus phage Kida]YP_009281046.1 hypothetical protein SAGEFAYGE_243 [Bacillus phage SageFayge]ASR78205.1 hypothetical protein PPISBEST_245 [Bacillus phage PPIsBest]AHZ10258.1 hypothetical protein [Bacillus phage Hakuna]AMW63163.1 hypothetical protein SAGEFAYGE_243 [Bacillus phage SageFayge]ANU80001.1 hypothetical protein KIDA_250 [Bacillus phage Kida]
MKAKHIFDRVDRSKGNEGWLSLSDVASEFQIWEDYISEPEDCRIKVYWLGSWYCTDTIVGFQVYFFDDRPMAFTTQMGRKCEENWYWASQEVAEDVKEYIKSLIVEEEDEVSVNLFNWEEEIGDGYRIDFSGQLFGGDHKATHNGRDITIKERLKHTEYRIDTDLIIEYNDTKEQARVSIRDLLFKFNLVEEDEECLSLEKDS